MHALCDTCTLHVIMFEYIFLSIAVRFLKFSFQIFLKLRFQSKTDQLDGQAERISWTDQLDGPAWWISRTNQLDGPVLYICSFGQFVHCRSFKVQRRPCLSKQLLTPKCKENFVDLPKSIFLLTLLHLPLFHNVRAPENVNFQFLQALLVRPGNNSTPTGIPRF